MSRILLFFPLAPYPLRANGLSMRYLPILRDLHARHDLDVLLLRRDTMPEETIQGVRETCRRLVEIPDPRGRTASLFARASTRWRAGLPWTPPNVWTTAGDDALREAVDEATVDRRYDAVLAVTGMFADQLTGIRTGRFVVDFIDSPTLTLRRNVHDDSGWKLERTYEAWKMNRWEARLIRRSTAAIYISSVDAAVISATDAPAPKRRIVPNGVSVEDFSELRAAGIEPPSIGFMGSMNYPPNVEAVLWLHQHVFLPLKRERPSLTLVVIGRDPVPEIARLADDTGGVIVTGAVATTWPYVNAVDVFTFPLLRGAGLKNKVLEAMYAQKPVVTTALGAEGTGAIDGRDLVIADGAESFRREVARLLDDASLRRALGVASRDLVSSSFSWARVLRDFESALLG